VIVGAPGYYNTYTNEGRATVYRGGSGGTDSSPSWTVYGGKAHAVFGYSVASAGSVDGNSYSDVIVGAFGYYNSYDYEGRATVYLGGYGGLSNSPSWTVYGGQEDAEFGFSVASVNVDGNAYSDVIVGALQYGSSYTREGRATVYLGGYGGLSTSPIWTAYGGQAYAYFGESVASAGDVNGDSYGDVIVSATGYDNSYSDEGRATVYLGESGDLHDSPSWTVYGGRAGAWLGNSVASAGDVNGDSYGDVIVGAALYNVASGEEGRATAYHGSSSGLSTSPSWTVYGTQAAARFGNSVASAGDVNGDSYSDVIVGQWLYDDGASENVGRALVYLGSW
jgi:hypothetical protein